MQPSSKPEENRPVRDEAYAAQRDELDRLLKDCMIRSRPLAALERPVLDRDGIAMVLQKIKNGLPFSRREREALVAAGFDVEKIYPDLS